MNGLFITGTDTEIGKTVITAGLLRALRLRGVDAVPMKPIQTGAEKRDGHLVAPDLEFHCAVSGYNPKPEFRRKRLAPYRYEPACSPHLAARLAGEYPDMDYIVACKDKLLDKHEFVLVEGAGGVMAPVDESRTMRDLMKKLRLPVVVVARRGLGTINHSLLSLLALKEACLDVFGIVFNETEDVEPDYIRKDNPSTVAAMGVARVLGNIDYMGKFTDTAWRRFETQFVALPALLERIQGR